MLYSEYARIQLPVSALRACLPKLVERTLSLALAYL
jgi:hypothetical protein